MSDRQIKKILEASFWLQSLETNSSYSRLHDDHDGTYEGVVTVGFSCDGDAWISIDNSRPIRFRTAFGGGMSLRTRNALLILAEAIRLDNEELPLEQNSNAPER